MMKKIAKVMGKVFMEMLTCVFAICCGCLVMDILYEYTSWSIGQDTESIVGGLFTLLGYMVIRYQTEMRIKEYVEKTHPKLMQFVTAAERIAKCDEDKVA